MADEQAAGIGILARALIQGLVPQETREKYTGTVFSTPGERELKRAKGAAGIQEEFDIQKEERQREATTKRRREKELEQAALIEEFFPAMGERLPSREVVQPYDPFGAGATVSGVGFESETQPYIPEGGLSIIEKFITAQGRVPRAETAIELAGRAAGEKYGRAPTAAETQEEVAQQTGAKAFTRWMQEQAAARLRPRIPASVRTGVGEQENSLELLREMQATVTADPTLTGAETYWHTLMSGLGIDTPQTAAFNRLRAQLQMTIAPIRKFFSGVAVTDPEAARTGRVLYDQLTAATDDQFLAALETLIQHMERTIATQRRMFKFEKTGVAPIVTGGPPQKDDDEEDVTRYDERGRRRP